MWKKPAGKKGEIKTEKGRKDYLKKKDPSAKFGW